MKIGKLLLGIVTFAVLASTIYLYVSIISGKFVMVQTPGSPDLPPAMLYFMLNAVVIFILMIVYLVSIVSNNSISTTKKVIWSALLLMLNVFVMPVLYFLYILPTKRLKAEAA